VCKLHKTLYKLQQAPKACYEKINQYLQTQGLTKNDADHNLYYLQEGRKMVIIVLYVDDLVIIVNQPH
jgi:hypothetical protein